MSKFPKIPVHTVMITFPKNKRIPPIFVTATTLKKKKLINNKKKKKCKNIIQPYNISG